jgi:hypothetical protein
MKNKSIVIVLLVGALLSALWGKNIWLVKTLKKEIVRVSVPSFEIGSVECGLANAAVRTNGLQLFHSQSFGPHVMADIPELSLIIGWKQVIRNKLFFVKELTLHVRSVTVVRDEQGEINLYELAALREWLTAGEQQGPRAFYAARVVLTVEKVYFVDYMRDGSIKEYAVDVQKKVFYGVHRPEWLVQAVTYMILRYTPLERYIGIKRAAIHNMLLDSMDRQVARVGDE